MLKPVYEKKPYLKLKREAEEDDVSEWSRKAKKTTDKQSSRPSAEDRIYNILQGALELMKSQQGCHKTLKDQLESLME